MLLALTRSRFISAFVVLSAVLVAIAVLITAPTGATSASAVVVPSASLVLPDKTALEVPDATERIAVDAYFDAGTASSPLSVTFTGSITTADLTLDGSFQLSKRDDQDFDHSVAISDFTMTHAPSGTGGITVSSIDRGDFEWGSSGFSGVVLDESAIGFAGNSGTNVGVDVGISAFYLQVNNDMTFAYFLEGVGNLIGTTSLSIGGQVLGQWNSTGVAIDESVAIGEETAAISLPVGASSLAIDFEILTSDVGPSRIAEIFRFVQTGPSTASDTGILILADEVLTRLGGLGEPRIKVSDAALVGLVLSDGSHVLQGSGPAVFENVDEGAVPTIAGDIVFEENTVGAAVQESFEVEGATVDVVVSANPLGFSSADLEFEVLGTSLLGDASFSQTFAGDITMAFDSGQVTLDDGTNDAATLVFPAASFLITSEGVQGSTEGNLSFASSDISLAGSPLFEIDTTIPEAFAHIAGSGVDLTINGQTFTGDVVLQEGPGGAATVVSMTLSDGASSFVAGNTEVIVFTNVGGVLLLVDDGVAGELAVDVAVAAGFAPTVFSGTPLLQINTTTVAVSEAVTVDDSLVVVELPTGTYVQLAFPSSGLQVAAAILNGDFIIDQIQHGADMAVRWSMMNISFDTGAGGMVDGAGAFLTTEAGTAGSLFGEGLVVNKIGLRHNDTGGAVDETIEFNGAPFHILFAADEGNISIVFTDDIDPVATITSPSSDLSVFADDVVKATYSCTDDGGSGVESCLGSFDGSVVVSGDVLDTSEIGTFTLTVVATDEAGNTAEATTSLIVKQRRPGDDQVARLYQAAFGRPADADGLGFWTDEYRDGATLTQIASRLLTSVEAVALYGVDGSNEDYVGALYLNALGRSADAGGLAYWISQLAQSSRADLLVSFSESPENIERTGTTPPLSSEASKVVRLYQAAFGRSPDAGGQAFWESVFADGTSLRGIASRFLSSPEAVARFGADPANEDFIEVLYRNVLGRAGDSGGVAFWLERMKDGATPVDVLVEFSESPENIDRTGTRP